ncbi:pectate lyase [Ceratobasidium sp. AG-Ba]|nr:pectate lyase [Ceratobasidium sp. AG-Ba]
MKFLSAISVLAIFAQITAGAPTVERRAAVSDEANIGYAAQGGTTGGAGGSTIVVVSGTISGDAVVKVGSNKSVVGKSGASLVGVGLRVNKQSNVIIRNLKISKVLASAGDAIGIQESSKVWVDHVDLSSDQTHDKDFYDGLLDVTHGSTFVSVTNSILHDHWKASLVGHSDGNGSEDKAITVTYALNKWVNLNSRMPSFRFGTGHLFNNYFLNSGDGINTRLGAQLLVENNVWESVKKALYSTDGGFAVARGNEFGGGSSTAPAGTFTKAPYSYTLLSASAVKSAVSSAGATLSF